MGETHLSRMSGIAGTAMQPLQTQLSDTAPETADRTDIQKHTPTPEGEEDFLVLAPGENRHSGPGENRQFWPDENRQSLFTI